MGVMKYSDPPVRIKELHFRVLTDVDIENISVVKVDQDESINAVGHIVKGGLYDLRLGKFIIYFFSYFVK